MKIRVLPPEVASGIAAGEVVDRPSSVVRELVQNSLDAGAGRIEVEVEGAGLRRIVVRDDGEGMAPDDALAAFTRHATSKLASLSDLSSISTHGFRGEALPSIVFAADVDLVTRPRGSDAGTRVAGEAGGNMTSAPAGCPVGTSVTVTGLFRNLPGRLKFMRGTAAETAACARTVQFHALARPEVGFRLVIDGNERLNTPAGADIRRRASDVLGRDAEGFIPFSGAEGALRAHGLAQAPGLVRGRARQWLFVNRRPVEDRGLRYSVIAAYGGQVPRDSTPGAVLFLDAPPERLDINVHPAKTEVRFADQGAVFGLVSRAIRASFGAPGVPGAAAHPDGGCSPPIAADGTGSLSFSGLTAGADRAGWSVPPSAPLPAPAVPAEALPGAGFEVIGQLFLTYILARAGEDFLVVDQHAAHEKVVYERLMAREARGGAVQELLIPQTVELSAEESVLVERSSAELAAAGIRLASLGGGTWAVNAVPAEADEDEAAELVRRVVADLSGAGRQKDREAIRHRTLAVVACHLAVRAGQRLSHPEMEALVRELFTLENPHSCPHGRPTTRTYSRIDLERAFARRP